MESKTSDAQIDLKFLNGASFFELKKFTCSFLTNLHALRAWSKMLGRDIAGNTVDLTNLTSCKAKGIHDYKGKLCSKEQQ